MSSENLCGCVYNPKEKISVAMAFNRTVERYGDHLALVHTPSELRQTWSEFGNDVGKTARGFAALGIARGMRVAIWGLTLPRWLMFYYALQLLGATPVLISPASRSNELGDSLVHADCVAVCSVGENPHQSEALKELLPELDGNGGRGSFAAVPSLRYVLTAGEGVELGITLDALWKEGEGIKGDFTTPEATPELCADEAMYLFTSGTTGRPKGVRLSHNAILHNAWCMVNALNLTGKDITLLPLPLFHSYGFTCGALSSLLVGGTLVCVDTFSPARVFSDIEKEKCTAIFGVPGMYRAMVKGRMRYKSDISTMRTGSMGGAYAPPELVEACFTVLNIPEFTTGYGSTECSPVIAHHRTTDPRDKKMYTVGPILANVDVRIADRETGAILPQGETGEICVKGPNVMLGYDKDPETTAKVIDSDGYFHTGDLGSLDAEGYLRIEGRIKDLIIRHGENISPREVEDCIVTFPGIEEVRVIGVPNEASGEEVCAFFHAAQDAEITAEELRQHCRAVLSPGKVPRYYVRMEAYPKTATGKIADGRLRAASARYFQTTSRSGEIIPQAEMEPF